MNVDGSIGVTGHKDGGVKTHFKITSKTWFFIYINDIFLGEDVGCEGGGESSLYQRLP